MTRNLDNIPDHLRSHALLTRNELLSLVPYAMAHIYRLEAAGRFPARVKIGRRRVAWRMQEVVAWLDSRPTVPPARRTDTDPDSVR